MSNPESGARHEFTSGQYPEDRFAFQAVTDHDGRAVLALSISEGSNVFAETTITVAQLAEFSRSMVAALHQVFELEAERQYGWVRKYLNGGVMENPFKTAGAEARAGDGS